jgi:hypothetical protein
MGVLRTDISPNVQRDKRQGARDVRLEPVARSWRARDHYNGCFIPSAGISMYLRNAAMPRKFSMTLRQVQRARAAKVVRLENILLFECR